MLLFRIKLMVPAKNQRAKGGISRYWWKYISLLNIKIKDLDNIADNSFCRTQAGVALGQSPLALPKRSSRICSMIFPKMKMRERTETFILVIVQKSSIDRCTESSRGSTAKQILEPQSPYSRLTPKGPDQTKPSSRLNWFFRLPLQLLALCSRWKHLILWP